MASRTPVGIAASSCGKRSGSALSSRRRDGLGVRRRRAERPGDRLAQEVRHRVLGALVAPGRREAQDPLEVGERRQRDHDRHPVAQIRVGRRQQRQASAGRGPEDRHPLAAHLGEPRRRARHRDRGVEGSLRDLALGQARRVGDDHREARAGESFDDTPHHGLAPTLRVRPVQEDKRRGGAAVARDQHLDGHTRPRRGHGSAAAPSPRRDGRAEGGQVEDR